MATDDSLGLTELQLDDMLGSDHSLIVCDLRRKEDFAKGHIKHSVLAKYDEEKLLDVPQNARVVLVSYDEEQSKKMAYALYSHNIDAHYLIGGIRRWSRGLYYTNISYVGTGYP
jgi:rhodanese-related sulfurtransferase